MQTDLLQDLPDFLVEADRDSVQCSVKTPAAKPLAMSGILRNRNALWNIQRFYGWQSVSLHSQNDKKKIKNKKKLALFFFFLNGLSNKGDCSKLGL